MANEVLLLFSSSSSSVFSLISIVVFYWFFIKKKNYYITTDDSNKQIEIDFKKIKVNEDLVIENVSEIYINTTLLPKNIKYIVSLYNDSTGEDDHKLFEFDKQLFDPNDENGEKKTKEFYIDFTKHEKYKVQEKITIFRVL